MLTPDNIGRAVRFVLGDPDHVGDRPEIPFHPLRIAFLADISSSLMRDPRTKAFPDVATFAFWCRRANIRKFADLHAPQKLRVGLGTIFHVTPSNVPINFAYSLVFAFLAGNSSVVRLPSREYPQVEIVLDAIRSNMAKGQYDALRQVIHVIGYDRDDAITEFWLQNTQGRILWGGDATIAHIRALKSHPRSREVAFADRYSLSAINARSLLDASPACLSNFCTALFNDIYVMDQNACSSPQLLVWVGGVEDIEAARDKLWPMFSDHAKTRYELDPIHAMDKFVDLCREIIEFPNILRIDADTPILTRISLDALSPQQCFQRGYFGTIHEFSADNIGAIAPIVNTRFQTLTYFGFTQETLKNFVISGRLTGIDRIVPVGRALEMGFYWDGFDIISTLTRLVDIQ